jgi:hypothetical protein
MAGVDLAGIAPVQVGERAAQPIRIRRRHDHMDRVGHQAIGPDLDAGLERRLRQ